MTTGKGVTNWRSSLPGRYGKSMRWQLWHSGLGGPVLAFWEGPMQMIKEGASPFGSVLGSPLLAFNWFSLIDYPSKLLTVLISKVRLF